MNQAGFFERVATRTLFGVNAGLLVIETLAVLFLFFASGWAGSAASLVFATASIGVLVVVVHLWIVVQSCEMEMLPHRSIRGLAIAPLVFPPAFVALYFLIL